MRRARVIICVLLLASCAAQQRSGARADGRLRLRATEMTTTGAHAIIRGTIENTFDEPVYGVRYMVTVYDTRTSKKVDVWQREVDATIKPGERAAVNLGVESQSMLGRNTRLKVTAHAIKLGGTSIPPPAGWKN